MKRILLPLFVYLLLAVSARAQQNTGKLDIQFDKNIVQPGDSLYITASFKDSGQRKLNLATLEMIIENETGMRSNLRWPIINGEAYGALHIPDSLPKGRYTILAAVQQRFFEVIGEIRDGENIPSIQAMLLTKTGEWDEQEVPVSSDGRFRIGNWLFEDNALLAFSRTKNSRQSLDIRISTRLDSSYKPLAVAGRAFYLGNPPPSARQSLRQPVETAEAAFLGQGTVLPAVVVRTSAKSRGQQFDEEHVSGLFQSGNERIVSVLDDLTAPSFTNLFNYLQGRVAGLQIRPVGVTGGAAIWRGSPVSFFLDEIRVSPQQIAYMPMTDIAIVKAFPPPFLGSPGGGGAIAVYTRRGGERDYLPGNKQVFQVKGYTPAATSLNMEKFGM